MDSTRALEDARTADQVVEATAACLRSWSAEEFARLVPGEAPPAIDTPEDIEEWADRLQGHARRVPLLEPEESARERLVRLFLMASVKLRLLERAGPPHVPARPRLHAIATGAHGD